MEKVPQKVTVRLTFNLRERLIKRLSGFYAPKLSVLIRRAIAQHLTALDEKDLSDARPVPSEEEIPSDTTPAERPTESTRAPRSKETQPASSGKKARK